MPPGRPVKSNVRQNIVNIIYLAGPICGYDIFKIYRKVFGTAPMRLIYYHLKKGASIGELSIAEIRKDKGEYSWGSEVEKIYYELGEKAVPIIDERIRKKLKSVQNKKINP